MDDTEPEIVTAKQLAAYYGVSQGKILEWYHEGVIPAEIAESHTFRFDREKVLTILRYRAALRAEGELRSHTPASYFPPPVAPPEKPAPAPYVWVNKDAQYLDPPPCKGYYMESHNLKLAREQEEGRRKRS